jgi:hypothetical protein
MDKIQINQKEMFDTVVTYLDTNVALWSSIAKVGEFKNAFSDVLSQIDEAQFAQQEAQVFLGKNKKQLKSVVAQKADILNDGIEAFALVTGKAKLEQKMATSYSELNRLRNADFAPAIKAIVKAAENHMEALADYGVTTEQVESLKTDFDGFLAINGQPRAYRVASVQATKDLALLFEQANDILDNKLDKVISIFKRRDPNFYNGYQAARVIVD